MVLVSPVNDRTGAMILREEIEFVVPEIQIDVVGVQDVGARMPSAPGGECSGGDTRNSHRDSFAFPWFQMTMGQQYLFQRQALAADGAAPRRRDRRARRGGSWHTREASSSAGRA
jgi:hypothetical protein